MFLLLEQLSLLGHYIGDEARSGPCGPLETGVMALGGRISAFDVHENSTWEEYVERIELYCAVNKVLEAVDKRAVLLSCCGQEAYSLISTLVKPLRPPNVEYQVLIDTVQNHIQPKPSELYSRYVFSKRDQEFGESVADYVTALRRLAGNCGFGWVYWTAEQG